MIEFSPPVPYSSGFRKLSGVYCLHIGDYYYLGSTSRLGARLSLHSSTLRRGVHFSPVVQQHYDRVGEYRVEILGLSATGDRDEMYALEQRWLSITEGDPHRMNLSSFASPRDQISEVAPASARQRFWAGPSAEAFMAARADSIRRQWREDPEFRARMLAAHKESVRPVTIQTADGERHTFDSLEAAGRALSVSAQSLREWVSGKRPWPGGGRNKPRAETRHLVGASGWFEGPAKS